MSVGPLLKWSLILRFDCIVTEDAVTPTMRLGSRDSYHVTHHADGDIVAGIDVLTRDLVLLDVGGVVCGRCPVHVDPALTRPTLHVQRRSRDQFYKKKKNAYGAI